MLVATGLTRLASCLPVF